MIPSATSTLSTSTARYVATAFGEGKAALAKLGLVDRWFTVFWLLGPFILLIERTPADVWLSVLAIAFVIRSVARREGYWLSIGWVRATFLFWFTCLLSASVSSFPLYSLGEAFAWIRFPLFAMATVFWLSPDWRLHRMMLLSTGGGMIVMSLILISEFFLIGPEGGNRLTWPYGDLVPGSYLAKTCMPVFVILLALATSRLNRAGIASGSLALFTMVVSFLTGERINFILRLCAGTLAALSWRPNWKKLILSSILILLMISTLALALPGMAKRYSTDLLQAASFGQQSQHYRVVGGGFVAFETSPVTGIGPGNYRLLSQKLLEDRPQYHPDLHPHNYYVQMLAETGIVGFLTGILWVGSILWASVSHSWRNKGAVVTCTAYIVPLAFFWPIATTGDFFGQWHNIFTWSGLALGMAAMNQSFAPVGERG